MKKIIGLALTVFLIHTVNAQTVETLSKGHISGSFESYSQLYKDDGVSNAVAPPNQIGSNNFLKIDYTYGKFVAGMQYESYLPSVQNYFSTNSASAVNDSKIVNRYFKYIEKNYSVQVGDFYEQFGNGIVLRSWENRPIGINNALEGVNIFIQPASFLKIKVLTGRTRNIFDYSNSTVRGADVEVDCSDWLNKKDAAHPVSLTLGGSYVSRYQGGYTGPVVDFPQTVDAYSRRLNLDVSGFTLGVEYVTKGSDPHTLNKDNFSTGNALLINTSYAKNNLGINITARALSNMDYRSEREVVSANANQLMINYLPSLSKQQDYLTSSIYVYSTQPLNESGIQTDVFYNFKEGTPLGGKYGMKLTLNYSYFGALNSTDNILSVGTKKYYHDGNIELKKKWNKKLETILTYQNIFYNKSVLQNPAPDVNCSIFAVSNLYKYAKKKSVRLVLEHLSTKDDGGNWAAGVAEFSFAPSYSFYLSDLWNYGTEGVPYYGESTGINGSVHYFNFGGSIAKNASRFSLSFGRQKAGLLCLGGVCRYVAASYGFTASLTTNF
ncbi:MAG: DUF6029 family protein [Bacteroidota bacterium]